ncbi:MAG: 50S ribosomal protein L20 [Marinilabiliaceae bacterium]|nr:50S ribosomal protein L20 [Marinilabiliaceae bacterium]
MPRSVNHVASRERRRKILKLTKGNFLRRRNVWTVAKNTWEKGQQYAFRDRRKKKSNFRALWIQRINAAARLEGLSYSKLMGLIAKQGIVINRKVLADLACNNPEAFKAVVNKAKEAAK